MSYQSSQDPEDKLPDWLKALRKRQNEEPKEEAKPEPPSQPPAAKGEDTEPTWLREIRERHSREQPTDEELLAEERALTDTQPTAPIKPLEKRRIESPVEPIEQGIPEEKISEPGSELPDWLTLDDEETNVPSELTEEETLEPEKPVSAFGEGEGETLSPGELPSWLQAIRPSESFPDEDNRSEEMLPSSEETAGPLAGLIGVLPAEPEVVQFGKPPVFSARLDVTESQTRHAAAFNRIVAAEGRPREDQGQQVALPTRVLNWVIAGAVFLAVLFPLITQSQGTPRPEVDAAQFEASTSVFNGIDILPPNAPVLIALEVQPSLYGELSAPAAAVLSHLLDKQARLVFISTQPTGPALAERLLQEHLSEAPSVATGDYVNLGYLSGGMAALRSFASDPRTATLSASAAVQNPWQSTTLLPIEQLSDFAMVFVITSDAEDGRAWIEQAGSSLPQGLYMIGSTQSAPLLKPYLRSDPPTLRGLVDGIGGATFYERLRNTDGLGREYWDAFSYGLGAIVLLILLGGLYSRLIHLRPEKPATQTEGKSA
jgi:hypothetical protein